MNSARNLSSGRSFLYEFLSERKKAGFAKLPPHKKTCGFANDFFEVGLNLKKSPPYTE